MEVLIGLVAIPKITHGFGQISQSLTMMVLTMLTMGNACIRVAIIMDQDGHLDIVQVVPQQIIFVN